MWISHFFPNSDQSPGKWSDYVGIFPCSEKHNVSQDLGAGRTTSSDRLAEGVLQTSRTNLFPFTHRKPRYGQSDPGIFCGSETVGNFHSFSFIGNEFHSKVIKYHGLHCFKKIINQQIQEVQHLKKKFKIIVV